MPRKRRFVSGSYDQINVTPLIDTVFFLLVIFMITAPLLEYSMDVSPPEMNTDEKLKPDENTKVVQLTKNGEIVFDKKTVTEKQLLEQLSYLKSSNPNKKFSILLRADGTQKYSRVIDVMKSIKKAGFKTLSLVTEAEQ